MNFVWVPWFLVQPFTLTSFTGACLSSTSWTMWLREANNYNSSCLCHTNLSCATWRSMSTQIPKTWGWQMFLEVGGEQVFWNQVSCLFWQKTIHMDTVKRFYIGKNITFTVYITHKNGTAIGLPITASSNTSTPPVLVSIYWVHIDLCRWSYWPQCWMLIIYTIKLQWNV